MDACVSPVLDFGRNYDFATFPLSLLHPSAPEPTLEKLDICYQANAVAALNYFNEEKGRL